MGRPVPRYWWKTKREKTPTGRVLDWIVVGVYICSDYPEFPRVAFFPLAEDEQYDIDKYERLIEDLKAGRLDPRKLAAELKAKEATRG